MLSKPLYEINADIDTLIESCIDPETGEVIEDLDERLNELTIARAEKIENLAFVIKNYKAEAEKLDKFKKQVDARLKAYTNNIERLKRYLASCMNDGEKFKSTMNSIYFMHTKSVNVSDAFFAAEENEQYMRVKKEANKDAIKTALDAGETVAGAELVENISLVVR